MEDDQHVIDIPFQFPTELDDIFPEQARYSVYNDPSTKITLMNMIKFETRHLYDEFCKKRRKQDQTYDPPQNTRVNITATSIRIFFDRPAVGMDEIKKTFPVHLKTQIGKKIIYVDFTKPKTITKRISDPRCCFDDNANFDTFINLINEVRRYLSDKLPTHDIRPNILLLFNRISENRLCIHSALLFINHDPDEYRTFAFFEEIREKVREIIRDLQTGGAAAPAADVKTPSRPLTQAQINKIMKDVGQLGDDKPAGSYKKKKGKTVGGGGSLHKSTDSPKKLSAQQLKDVKSTFEIPHSIRSKIHQGVDIFQMIPHGQDLQDYFGKVNRILDIYPNTSLQMIRDLMETHHGNPDDVIASLSNPKKKRKPRKRTSGQKAAAPQQGAEAVPRKTSGQKAAAPPQGAEVVPRKTSGQKAAEAVPRKTSGQKAAAPPQGAEVVPRKTSGQKAAEAVPRKTTSRPLNINAKPFVPLAMKTGGVSVRSGRASGGRGGVSVRSGRASGGRGGFSMRPGRVSGGRGGVSMRPGGARRPPDIDSFRPYAPNYPFNPSGITLSGMGHPYPLNLSGILPSGSYHVPGSGTIYVGPYYGQR